MSYKSEIKKVLKKYYPKYKVEKVFVPYKISNLYTSCLQIDVKLKKPK
jgi:hypothetical protein